MKTKPLPYVTCGVTHGNGKAHADDFLFACIFCAIYPELTLYRAEVAHEEWLNSKNVIVCDMGGICDYEMNNFDHHAPQDNYQCGVMHYMEKLGLKDAFYEAFNGACVMDNNDINGLQGVASYLGLPTDESSILKYRAIKDDIINESMITIFSRKKELKQGDSLHEIMVDIGKNIIERCENIAEQYQLFDNGTHIKQLCGLTVADQSSMESNKINFGFNSWCKKNGHIVDFVIAKDGRTDGNVRLMRQNEKLDFNLWAKNNSEKVHFVHASGFLVTGKSENILPFIEEIIETSKIKND